MKYAPNPTASGLEAALHCAASVVLPRATSTNPWAEDGQARHEYLRRVLPPTSMPAKVALHYVPLRLRRQCEAIHLSDLVGDLSTNVRAEVSYGIHVDTGEVRELGVGLDRKYPKLGARWIMGTLDIEGERLDGAWVVKDWKTGHADVTAADDGNAQLLFFARALATLHPDREIVGLILRLSEDGAARSDSRATYDAFELDAFLLELRAVLDRIAAMRRRKHLEVNEGPWCRWCPAFSHCPAKQALARRLVPELDAIKETIADMSVQDCGKAWLVLRKIRPVYESITKALKERAKIEPIPLEVGKFLRPIRYMTARFDTAAAVLLLRELGATESQIDELRRDMPVEQVREGKLR